jgi:formylglycine-generating enzyme required for sulfatase activity
MKIFFIIPLLFFISCFNLYAQPDTGLVYVPSGSFKMGSKHGETDEQPVHKVKISGFYIGKYEVTNREFVEFLNAKGNQFEHNVLWINTDGHWRNLKCRINEKDGKFFVDKAYEYYPVNFVSWYGANAYCKWKGGRLPTEAEWEYIVKKYPLIKDSIDTHSWHSANSNNQIHKIAQAKPNILGIYDLLGNLWEWCADWYDNRFYEISNRKNPLNNTPNDYKVIRGGSWANDKSMLNISNRNAIKPNINKVNVGFRIAYDE